MIFIIIIIIFLDHWQENIRKLPKLFIFHLKLLWEWIDVSSMLILKRNFLTYWITLLCMKKEQKVFLVSFSLAQQSLLLFLFNYLFLIRCDSHKFNFTRIFFILTIHAMQINFKISMFLLNFFFFKCKNKYIYVEPYFLTCGLNFRK